MKFLKILDFTSNQLPFFLLLTYFSIVRDCSFLFAQGTSTSNDLIIINGRDELKLVGTQIYYFEDAQGKLGIEDLLKKENQDMFKRNENPVFLKPASDKTYWLKMTIENKSKEDLFVELGSEFMDYIDYYVEEGNGYSLLSKTGFRRPIKDRPYPNNPYWFLLKKKEAPQTVYFRVYSEGLFEVPFVIGTRDQLYRNKSFNDFAFYGFLGFLLSMFGYNLFLFITLRERIYAIYLGYLVTAFFTVSFINNQHFFTYIGGDDLRTGMYLYHSLWTNLLFLFIALFAINFLSLKSKLPVSYYLLLGYITLFNVLLPVIEIFHLIHAYFINNFLQMLVFSMIFVVLISGSYLWIYKKENEAKFYIFAWIWVILSGIITILTLNSILPYNFMTRNSAFFGFGLEILFFSLALGDRYNKIRKENLKIIEEKKEELEIMVKERTIQLYESNEELLQATEDIMAKNDILSDQNKAITDSINYAQRIQEAILPFPEEIAEYLKDYFIFFKPRDIVSGDFYYFQAINDKLVIAAIDCTGHGVPGAFMSLLGKEILDNIVVEREILIADLILNELHKGIRKVLKQNQNDNQDGMDISLVVVNQDMRSLEFAGAKNSLIYVSNNDLKVIKGDKMPIGGGEKKEKERLFTRHLISLEANTKPTTFYLFSDGYQDQFGSVEKKKFMIAQMKNMFLETHSLPMKHQKDILNLRLEKWISEGKEKQTDDILVMGIRI